MSTKHFQYLVAGGLGVLGLSLIAFLLWSVDDGPVAPEKERSTRIDSAGSQINAQELWVARMEGENKLTTQKLEALEKALMAQAQQETTAHKRVSLLEQELEGLKQTPPLEMLAQNPPPEVPLPPGARGMRKISLKLSPDIGPLHGKKQKSKTVENTLPAGTFIRAVLLGGVDASTATAAPSDPRPVLLRLVDLGTLPRKFRSDLKDCHVLASAYGDLSSERVYMRLEKLTCVERLTGEIIETEIAGYVAGEDGKAGVRGVVVDRTGPLIRNSLLGGFFSGMGKFFEASQAPFAMPVLPGNGVVLPNPSQMLTAGAAQGTSQALDKFAEFYIKRAEQLQPVLQIAAGREVDIVITQGTSLGETSVRKALTTIRNRSRQEAVQSLSQEEPNL